MWPGDLAPDDADLGSTDFLLAAVDIGDLLAKVEAIVENSQYTQTHVSSGSHSQVTYLAAGVSSTPSILIRLVPGVVT